MPEWLLGAQFEESFIHSLDSRQLLLVFNEMLLGDGSKQGNKSGWLWTPKKSVADALSAAAVVRGITSSVAPFVTKNGVVVYRVSIRVKQFMTSDPRDSRSARKEIVPAQNGEKVWCVSSSAGTLITRRNGKIALMGNCPVTSCCILARPTKSLIRYIQMVGRVLRPHEGKQFATVIDHSGVVRRLGWPTEELPYDLDDGKPKEAKPKENLPKVCPSCFAVFKKSLRKCPVCQFEPKPMPKAQEVEDGQLVQLSKKATKFSPADKQAIYSAWLGWVKEKGFKEGAAYHRYKEMIGCYPNNQLDKVPGPMVESVRDWITHENIKYAKSHASIFRKAA
jgi:hypothetical protein